MPHNEEDRIVGLIVRDLKARKLNSFADAVAKAIASSNLETTVERLLGKVVQVDDILNSHCPELVARIKARRTLATQGKITYPQPMPLAA